MDKYIEVVDRHHVREKQKVQILIKLCDNNRDTLIAGLYNMLLAPDICDSLISIITLMNSKHTCLFQKCFCIVYFGTRRKCVYFTT